jgi:outer membrane receptor protein involved in Fe transport
MSKNSPRVGSAWVLTGCLALAAPGAALGQLEEIVVTARKKEESLQEVPISITAFGAEQIGQQGILSDADVADLTIGFSTLQQVGRDLDRPVIRGMAAPASRGDANASYFIDGAFFSGSVSAATTQAVERIEILRGPQSAQFGRATFSGAVNYVTKRPTDTLEGQVKTRAGTSDDYEVSALLRGPITDTLGFVASAGWTTYGGQWRNQLRAGQAFSQPAGAYLVDPPQAADNRRLGQEETLDFLLRVVWQPVAGTEVDLKYGYTEADDGHFPSLVAPSAAPLAPLPIGDPRLGLADTHGGGVGIFQTLNCQLAPPEFYQYLYDGNTDPFPGEQPWWRTSPGAICGELNGNGWENRINLPDFSEGVTTSNDEFIRPFEPGLRKHQNRVLLEYRQELGEWQVTARGAYNDERFYNGFDLDHTETRPVFGLFNFALVRPSDDWSAELRIATPVDWPVHGSLGFYHFDGSRKSTQRSFPGPGGIFGSYQGYGPYSKRAALNSSVFGTVFWDIGDQWRLDFEGRYASDEVSFRGGNGFSLTSTDYNFTPRLSLNYRPTPDINLYVQAANGDKPGDFNGEYFRADVAPGFAAAVDATTSDVRVQPEEQWTYEIGAKTEWLDRRLRANLTLYLIEWERQAIFQTVNFGAYDTPGYNNDETLVTTILRNVGDSRNVGAEFESSFQVTDELLLSLAYAYTRAKFTAGCDGNLANLTGTTGRRCDAQDPAERGPDGDVSGNWIPSAPEHNIVLGMNVTKPIGESWDATLRFDWVYESERYIDTTNKSWLGDRRLVNLRLGASSDHWTITGYVRNLLDDDTPNAGLSFVNFGYGALLPGNDGNFGTDDDIYPYMTSLNPQRGRDWGLELQYRFGN